MQMAKEHFENFITNVYNNTVKEEETIRAQNQLSDILKRKQFAKKYVSISHFIDALPAAYGGEVPPDWEEKRKYCKFRATLLIRSEEEEVKLVGE